MVPPSMVAACCITAAVCGNEKFSANTPEGILSKMQVGIAVETVSQKNNFIKDFPKFHIIFRFFAHSTKFLQVFNLLIYPSRFFGQVQILGR